MFGISPTAWLWLVALLLMAWLLLRLDRKRGNNYNFVDILMNASTNKADLGAHVVFLLTLMSIWVIVDRSNDGKDVDNLVSTVLGILVLGRVAGRGIDAWKDKGQ